MNLPLTPEEDEALKSLLESIKPTSLEAPETEQTKALFRIYSKIIEFRKPKSPMELDYIERARDLYVEDGKLEIDDVPLVSLGDDPGAYVQAWVWVPADPSFNEFGVKE